jgi:LacI family transcriptional regulator
MERSRKIRQRSLQRSLNQPNQVPRVAIILYASVIAQDLLRGIARYVRSHRPWQVFLEVGTATAPTTQMEGWTGDGIIAQVRGFPLLNWIVQQKVPTVANTTENLGPKQIPFPAIDKNDEAELAADHFHSRGLRHFAFCAHASGVEWGRQQPFVNAAESKGGVCHVYQPSSPSLFGSAWEEQFKDLCRWLRELPKPIGIFAANDQRGYQIIDACRHAGFRVPEDVAVLGDDNDQAICDLSNPPLSSIQRPHEEMGYRCAALLDAALMGRKITPQPLLPPARLILRQSTDVLAVDDPEVATAIRFIRQNLSTPFSVKHLLREIPIGRRALEQRFYRMIGRTLGREIRRLRVNRATELLVDTQLPMPEIAKRCGFSSAPRLTEAFHRELGRTPTSYRSRHA